MAHDFHRAALAIACVFAVVFGASLFPATGFGTNPVPASGSGDSTAGDGASVDGPNGDVNTTTAGAQTTEEETTAEPTTSPGESTSTEEAATNRTTTTESTTTAEASGSDGPAETTTAAAGATGDSSSNDAFSTALTVLVGLTLGVLVLVGSAVGFGRHHRGRYPDDWSLPSAPHLRVVAYVRRIPQTSLAFVMFAGTNAPDILDQLGSTARNATSGIGSVTSGLGTFGSAVGSGLLKVPGGFVTGIGALGRGVGSVSLSLSSLSTGFDSGGFLFGGEDRPDSDPRSGGHADAAEAEPPDPPDPPSSVREAWDRFQEDLGVEGADGRTPGEIARQAVERGVPSDAIDSLTGTFRDVRYGGRADDSERATTARNAYQRIRMALERDSS